jgi:hypothetical protein
LRFKVESPRQSPASSRLQSPRADIAAARSELSAILSADAAVAKKLLLFLVTSALAGRDSAAATQAIAAIPPEGLQDFRYDGLAPREWYAALAARSVGDIDVARNAFIIPKLAAAIGTIEK